MTEIPEIEDSGSTGEQESSLGEVLPANQESPFHPSPIMDAVQGLAANKPRSMGSEAVANLLSATLAQFSNNYEEAKVDIKATQDKLDATRDELSEHKTQVAVLNERVATATRWRHLRSFVMVMGTSFAGLGFSLLDRGIDVLAFLVAFGGLSLLLTGWFWPLQGPSK